MTRPSKQFMNPQGRRDFLKLFGAAVPGLSFMQGPPRVTGPRLSLTKFIDPLPLPQTLKPLHETSGAVEYRVRMLEFSRKMHSELLPTRMWGYEGQHPGPTIEATRGKKVSIVWENHLPDRHLFPVDRNLHGAMSPAPEVRTVPHLHGSRTDSRSDGLPENWFTAGKSARYVYPNDQNAATLWYHDHSMGITRLNMYAGLAGFYLLRDETERAMSLPSGEYEIPLLLQDRTLGVDGQLLYTPSLETGEPAPAGVWGSEFFGNLPVVNGAIYPYLEVEPRCYRFRMLNAANSRFFNLFMNLAARPTDVPRLVPLHQIGSDGGFLPAPAVLNKLLLGPAERADVLVDFSGLEGKTVTLANDAATPFPGWTTLNAAHEPLNEIMQIRVTRTYKGEHKAFSMPSLAPVAKIDVTASTVRRDFVLSECADPQGHCAGILINGLGYDAPVTEKVKLGSTEVWRFINTTDDAHPMHLHLVQFQIIERQGYDLPAYRRDGTLKLVGRPRPPQANESGWKDTAVVLPGETMSLAIRFEGYTGRYVFHCHMLEHEDNDMMRPFEVVAG